MHYFIIAGEASGDLHGGALATALKTLDTGAVITFIGGNAMSEAVGETPLLHCRDMAFMGFGEVVRNIGRIQSNLRFAKDSVLAAKPDALILIDDPSFNLKVAAKAHKAGIPVYYFIPPKVWAWKKWRLATMRRLVRRVLSILPFEPEFYKAEGAEAVYVGNPSVAEVAAEVAAADSRDVFLARHKLRDRPLVALMPGSRQAEIRENLPIMAAAVDRFPQYRGVIIGSSDIPDALYARYGGRLPIVREPHAARILVHCRAALVTSGTATLETALAGVPQVAMYHGNGSEMMYKVMKRVLTIPYVTLPNLIANRDIIPELLLHQCTADSAAGHLGPLLRDTPERNAQLQGYSEISRILGTENAADNAAALIIEDLEKIRKWR